MSAAPLRIDYTKAVARVVLSRPDVHNAFDDAVIASLHRAAEEVGSRNDLRVVVLASEGPSFSAGADLRWMRRMAAASESENRADAVAMARMFEAWAQVPRPVVARVQGAALGGGVGLVAVADIVVASRTAVFGFTEVRLGLLPAVIAPFALAKLGPAAARELFLTGDRFGAERARELGLVHRVTDPEDLDAEVDRVIATLHEGGPEAQGRAKGLLAEIAGLAPEAARDRTTGAIAAARVGPEGQEGMQAFFEKRAPTWRDRS